MVGEAFAEVVAVEVNMVEEEDVIVPEDMGVTVLGDMEVTVLEVMGVIVLEDMEVDMGVTVLAMGLATFVDKLLIK